MKPFPVPQIRTLLGSTAGNAGGDSISNNNTMKKTVSERILATLIKGKAITPIQALNDFGCLRLSARIHDLRSEGWNIKTESHKTKSGKTVAKYRL